MIAAPAEGPTIMPSAWVTLVAHSTHSAVETWPHSSTTPRGASLSSAAGLPAPWLGLGLGLGFRLGLGLVMLKPEELRQVHALFDRLDVSRTEWLSQAEMHALTRTRTRTLPYPEPEPYP